MKRIFLFVLSLVSVAVVTAADYTNVIVPIPVKCTAVEGEFTLTPKVVVRASTDGLVSAAKIFAEDLSAVTSSTLAVKKSSAKKGAVNLAINPALASEEYTLKVSADGVNIVGGTERAVFYGLQSLLQIATASDVANGGLVLSGVEIADKPHFEYQQFRRCRIVIYTNVDT